MKYLAAYNAFACGLNFGVTAMDAGLADWGWFWVNLACAVVSGLLSIVCLREAD